MNDALQVPGQLGIGNRRKEEAHWKFLPKAETLSMVSLAEGSLGSGPWPWLYSGDRSTMGECVG